MCDSSCGEDVENELGHFVALEKKKERKLAEAVGGHVKRTWEEVSTSHRWDTSPTLPLSLKVGTLLTNCPEGYLHFQNKKMIQLI